MRRGASTGFIVLYCVFFSSRRPIVEEKRKKSNKITIYLIKDDIAYDEILKDYAYKNILRKDENSITYYYPTRKNKPEWLITYFNET